jgi:hypothetical protein
MEPANVGQDHDAGATRLRGAGEERGELVAVGGFEGDKRGVERAAGDRWDRWMGIMVETHGDLLIVRTILQDKPLQCLR